MAFRIVIIAFLFISSGAFAGGYEDAARAYRAKDYAAALATMRQLAGDGDGRAQSKLGVMYEKGQGVGVNKALALQWYKKAARTLPPAAAAGDAEAQYELGNLYLNGRGVGEDLARAARWHLAAAWQNHRNAIFNLGWMTKRGKGVKKDPVKSLYWYGRAADLGDGEARKFVGNFYAKGLGTPRDLAKALAEYRRAYEMGHTPAVRNMGWHLALNPEMITPEIIAWMHRAVLSGDAKAKIQLAKILLHGRLPARDPGKAIASYRAAAEQGDFQAQAVLARHYAFGEKSYRNAAAAAKWLSAASGAPEKLVAMRFGLYFWLGSGEVKDPPWGVRLLQLATEKGEKSAHILLGLIHGVGLGVPIDQEKSAKHFRLAERHGVLEPGTFDKFLHWGDDKTAAQLIAEHRRISSGYIGLKPSGELEKVYGARIRKWLLSKAEERMNPAQIREARKGMK